MASAPAKPIVVVFTGNSNTGSTCIRYLLDKFKDTVTVRAVIRKKQSAEDFKGLPVEIINADITQPALLKGVFAGDVNACFWTTPATADRAALTKLFVDACIAHGVDFPVIISSLGANEKETVFQKQFAEIEEYCAKKTGTPVKKQTLDTGKQVLQPIILRASLFYQNMFGSLAGIEAGTLYYPLALNGVIAHVDLEDIGKCAACILANPEPHAGKTYNLIGEYQAGNQIASAITMNTGKGCKYEAVDDETAEYAFQALGLPDWIAHGNIETLRWFRSGKGQNIESDIKAITGDAPRKFAKFVKDALKPAMDAQ